MPTYEFVCPKCDKEYEITQKIADPNPPCPVDGETLKKQISKINIRHGAGLYSIDTGPETKME